MGNGGLLLQLFSPAQHRRNLLVRAAEAIARVPTAPITISDIPPEPLEELKSAGVLRDNDLGHSVVFTHDIYEEWALCELLVHRRANIQELLRGTPVSDTLIRPMQLLARVFIGNELVTGRVEGAVVRCDGRYRAATGLAARHSDILRAVDANHAAIAKAETVFARRRCRSLAKTASCNENNRGVAQPVLSEPKAHTR